MALNTQMDPKYPKKPKNAQNQLCVTFMYTTSNALTQRKSRFMEAVTLNTLRIVSFWRCIFAFFEELVLSRISSAYSQNALKTSW